MTEYYKNKFKPYLERWRDQEKRAALLSNNASQAMSGRDDTEKKFGDAAETDRRTENLVTRIDNLAVNQCDSPEAHESQMGRRRTSKERQAASQLGRGSSADSPSKVGGRRNQTSEER